MRYSAQIRQDFDRFVREYGASIDIATFVRLYWGRREGAKAKTTGDGRPIIREFESHRFRHVHI
jgi:hypothetical protein